MKNQDNADGWNDGWHTQASTGDSMSTLRDSVIGTAKAAVKSVNTRDSSYDSKTKTREDGWSGDGHATANPRESFSALRDSSVEAAKSTAKMATTREGWWKIARGTGKVAAATAVLGVGLVRNLFQDPDSITNEADPYSPWSRQAPGEQIYGPEGLGHYENGSRVD